MKKNKKFDSEEAERILQGPLESRVVAYAEYKYGRETADKIAARLNVGYRDAAKDAIEVLRDVCSGNDDSLEDKVEEKALTVYEEKPSLAKVVAKGTLSVINKTCWYYPLVGALPGKAQEYIAKKLGENEGYYMYSNIFVGGAAAAGATAVFLSYVKPDNLSDTILAGILIGLVYSGVAGFIRHQVIKQNSKLLGSPLVCLPYYAALYTVLGIVAAGKAIKSSYSSVYDDEKKKLKGKKIPEENKLLIKKRNKLLGLEQEQKETPVENDLLSDEQIMVDEQINDEIAFSRQRGG